MPALTIKNGRVIDPANGVDQKTDITLERGKVAKLGKVSKPAGKVFDASGCVVAPGLIDPHVHLREPGQEDKETIATGSAAAVNGGFTTIVCMANTAPTIDDDSRVEYVYHRAKESAQCNVFATGAVTKGRKGEELAEMALMAGAGAVAFTDDGDAIASASMMVKALTYVKMTGKCMMQHCEEPTLVNSGSMNGGALATRLGLAARPAIAEVLIIQRDIALNQSVGCRYHVQHLSTAEGVDLIRRARKAGQPVTTEVSPHHLLLTEADCAGYDPNYRMNPPLRTKADIKGLLKAVKDGTITILATDHAPHTREEKELGFAEAPAGIIGLDCALPLYIEALIDTGTIDWPRLIDMMTAQPAALCDLHTKGHLSIGADADVTIIDPKAKWTIDVNAFASKARNCPFHGRAVTGRAIAVIIDGKVKLNRDRGRTG